MAEVNPPYVMQDHPTTHPAVLFRRTMGGIFSDGIGRLNGSLDLKVIPNSPIALSVLVSRGGAYVKGTHAGSVDQGLYFVYNNSDRAVTIAATSNGTNKRIDTIIARVYDTEYEGGASTAIRNDWKLETVSGAEVISSGTPVAPTSLPVSSYALANVVVTGTTIATADITDLRSFPTIPSLGANTVTAAMLQDNSVTTAKIADGAITSRKMSRTTFWQQLAADQILTTSWVDIPALKVDYTSPVDNMKALVIVTFGYNNISSSTQGVYGRVLLDGAPVGGDSKVGSRVDVSSQQATITWTGILTLATAGAHTIQPQVAKTRGTSTVNAASLTTMINVVML